MRNTLFYLIIYDVPDSKAGNKRRSRLHKLLSGYGKWTQYSVGLSDAGLGSKVEFASNSTSLIVYGMR
jgi:hypothetical protein